MFYWFYYRIEAYCGKSLIDNKKGIPICTAPQKLDIKNLTFGVFFYEINL